MPVSASAGSTRATWTEPRRPVAGQIAASESASRLAGVDGPFATSRAADVSGNCERCSGDEHAPRVTSKAQVPWAR